MIFGLHLLDSAILAGYLSVGPRNWGQLFIWIGCAIALGVLASWLISTWARSQITEDRREWPHRTTCVLAALFFTGIAIYGSLVPWHFRPTDWQSAAARFAEAPYLDLGIGSRADWVANILLFMAHPTKAYLVSWS